mmetsp:Transcript_11503/g.32288  ORF Transcript_11503/g.32288 Transcript_11503/m.32288 type:complete len:201 (+) Transcript_11503:1494-2096(+)
MLAAADDDCQRARLPAARPILGSNHPQHAQDRCPRLVPRRSVQVEDGQRGHPAQVRHLCLQQGVFLRECCFCGGRDELLEFDVVRGEVGLAHRGIYLECFAHKPLLSQLFGQRSIRCARGFRGRGPKNHLLEDGDGLLHHPRPDQRLHQACVDDDVWSDVVRLHRRFQPRCDRPLAGLGGNLKQLAVCVPIDVQPSHLHL